MCAKKIKTFKNFNKNSKKINKLSLHFSRQAPRFSEYLWKKYNYDVHCIKSANKFWTQTFFCNSY